MTDELLALAERCTAERAPQLTFGVWTGRGLVASGSESTVRLVCDWWNARYEVASALRMQADQWQPIETAPKDGSRVLLWTDTRALADQTYIETVCESEHFAMVQIGAWEECWGGGMDWDTQKIGEPTHWMPLPPPPVTREGGDG